MSDVIVLTLPRVENLGEMVAIGLGLPRETLRDAGKYGQVILDF